MQDYKVKSNITLLFVFILLTIFLLLDSGQIKKDIFLGDLEVGAFNADKKSTEDNQITADNLTLTSEDTGDLGLNAGSAISIEFENNLNQVLEKEQKVLFKKDEEKKLPMASLAKLMAALVVLDQYDLNQKITVSESAMAQVGEQGDLKLGQILSVKNLLYIALIESSNRAAFALSEVIGTDNFVSLMNDKAQKMGLINTGFKDSTGLDPKTYSTAKDISILSKYLFENYSLFREITNIQEFDLYLEDGSLHHKLVNTNKFLGQVPGVIGGKTGWTQLAKGCFMVIQKSQDNKKYLIYVILGAEDRFLEMRKLITLSNH